jgi:type VI protein secretion system component VasF
MGWIGALMILIHGGIHFNAVIPWLALLFMLIVVGSGITGKYLLKEAKEKMISKENELRQNNFTEQEIEQELLSHSLLVDTMQQWRRVHMPLSMIFFALALLHIVFTMLLWRWN